MPRLRAEWSVYWSESKLLAELTRTGDWDQMAKWLEVLSREGRDREESNTQKATVSQQFYSDYGPMVTQVLGDTLEFAQERAGHQYKLHLPYDPVGTGTYRWSITYDYPDPELGLQTVAWITVEFRPFIDSPKDAPTPSVAVIYEANRGSDSSTRRMESFTMDWLKEKILATLRKEYWVDRDPEPPAASAS